MLPLLLLQFVLTSLSHFICLCLCPWLFKLPTLSASALLPLPSLLQPCLPRFPFPYPLSHWLILFSFVSPLIFICYLLVPLRWLFKLPPLLVALFFLSVTSYEVKERNIRTTFARSLVLSPHMRRNIRTPFARSLFLFL